MTEQERQQAFLAAFNALCQQYGFTFKPVFARAEMIGHQLQIEPGIELVPIRDWQPSPVNGAVLDAEPIEETRIE